MADGTDRANSSRTAPVPMVIRPLRFASTPDHPNAQSGSSTSVPTNGSAGTTMTTTAPFLRGPSSPLTTSPQLQSPSVSGPLGPRSPPTSPDSIAIDPLQNVPSSSSTSTSTSAGAATQATRENWDKLRRNFIPPSATPAPRQWPVRQAMFAAAHGNPLNGEPVTRTGSPRVATFAERMLRTKNSNSANAGGETTESGMFEHELVGIIAVRQQGGGWGGTVNPGGGNAGRSDSHVGGSGGSGAGSSTRLGRLRGQSDPPTMDSSKAGRRIGKFRAGSLAQSEVASLSSSPSSPSRNATVDSSSSSSTMDALQRLGNTLDRFKQMDHLPNPSIIMSELGRPFLDRPVDKDACSLSLDIFWKIKEGYASMSGQEELDRWLWCCRAMEVDDPLTRNHISQILLGVIVPPSSSSQASPSTPFDLLSLVAALASLSSKLRLIQSSTSPPSPGGTPASGNPYSQAHRNIVSSLLTRVVAGQVIYLDPVETAAYFGAKGVLPLPSTESANQIIVLEALAKCASSGQPSLRCFVLEELFQQFWLPSIELPPVILGQILRNIGRSCAELLARTKSDPSIAQQIDIFVDTSFSQGPGPSGQPILRISVYNLLLKLFPPDRLDSLAPDLVQELVTCFLSLLTCDGDDVEKDWYLSPNASAAEVVNGILAYLQDIFLNDPHQEAIKTSLARIIAESDLDSVVIPVVGAMTLRVSEFAAAPLATECIPLLFSRLNLESSLSSLASTPSKPQSISSPSLSKLLNSLSSRYATTFYKPLFSCAASDKEDVVRQNLRLLHVVDSLMGPLGIFFRDAEMVTIATMADVGGAKGNTSGDGPGGAGKGWGTGRLGQMALLVEMIVKIKGFRENRKDTEIRAMYNFCYAFENRLTLFIGVREQSALLTLTQRLLVASLLLNIRLLSRATTRPPWLPLALNWARTSYIGALAEPASDKPADDPFSPEILSGRKVTEEIYREVQESLHWIKLLYEKIEVSERQQHMGNALSASSRWSIPELTKNKGTQTPTASSKRLAFLSSLSPYPAAPTLSLLVAIYGHLSESDLVSICAPLWHNTVDERKSGMFLPAAFLLMQCGDRTPKIFTDVIEADLQSASWQVRRDTVAKLMALFSARYDLLTFPFADRSKRKIFRGTRQHIDFVATDIGTPNFTFDETTEPNKINLGASLPLEVRRALLDLGWNNEAFGDKTTSERQRTPLSILPTNLPSVASEQGVEIGMPRTPGGGDLLRRNSSGHGSGRRRAVVVPSFAAILVQLARLAGDENEVVATCASDSLVTLLRDDSASMVRPLLERLSGSLERQRNASSIIHGILMAQPSLPPSFTHSIFNHIVGMLKVVSRDPSRTDALSVLASSLPVAAEIAPLVNDISMRDFRKNKIEYLLVGDGSYFFNDFGNTPEGPMFPRSIHKAAPKLRRLALREPEFMLAAARVAQNLLLASYIRKVGREAYTVKKSLNRLELPSFAMNSDLSGPLKSHHFLPRFSESEGRIPEMPMKIDRDRDDSRNIALIISRSWLQLIREVVRGLNRNFSDRAELERIFDGVNRALIILGDDPTLVGQVLTICMLASTRFRRLFHSSSGFTMFIPALYKCFCEAKNAPSIREGIGYAWQRFFFAHEEAFVFQALGSLAPIICNPRLSAKAQKEAADHLSVLLGFLLSTPAAAPSTDALGITGTNDQEEREMLINRINERPEVFLGAMVKGQTEAEMKTIDALVETQKTFPAENIPKLFFTVIAVEPSSVRSRDFLDLLRLLLPYLYNASSSTRALLREGLDAMAALFAKAVGTRANIAPSGDRKKETLVAPSGDPGLEQPASPLHDGVPVERDTRIGNWDDTRKSFVALTAAYYNLGGEVSSLSLRKVLDIARALLKDSAESHGSTISIFLNAAAKSLLNPNTGTSPKQTLAFLKEFSPTFRSHVAQVDFSLFLDALCSLVTDKTIGKDPIASSAILGSYLGAGIDACAAYTAEHATSPLRIRSSVIRLSCALIMHATDVDVMAEVERQDETTEFIATFVLPLCVELPTFSESSTVVDVHDFALRSAWARLLVYTMSAWERSARSRNDVTRRAGLAFACQVVMIIAVRAEPVLARVPGTWSHLAVFFQRALSAAKTKRALMHSQTSPGASRAATPADEERVHPKFTQNDYSLWALLEFLSLYKSPLVLHLRLFLREKLAEIRFAPSVSARGISHFGPLTTPDRRRTSIYARPLLSRSNSRDRRKSAREAGGAEVEQLASIASPSPTPLRQSSQPMLLDADGPRSTDKSRRTSMNIFMREYLNVQERTRDDATQLDHTQPSNPGFPAIKHLGPVPFISNPFTAPLSPGLDQQVGHSTVHVSRAMALRTLRRIRTVQIVMGEIPLNHSLLDGGEQHPLDPNKRASSFSGLSFYGEEDRQVAAWTARDAQRHLAEESAVLATEFPSLFPNYPLVP